MNFRRMSFRQRITNLLVTVVLGISVACVTSPPTKPVIDEASAEAFSTTREILHPLLWKLQKKGKTNYLFATIHVFPNACKRLPIVVYEKLNTAKLLWVETDEG